MIEKVDVVKELEVKNREIYLNKLDIDLDSNLELLKLTTTNFINISILEVVSAVLNIEGSFLNKTYIEESVKAYFDKFSEMIFELYKKRFAKLKGKKKDDDYLSFIDSQVVNDIMNYYDNQVDELMSVLNSSYNQFENDRLSKYLLHTYREKLVERINDLVGNANMILINNYHESKERFALINEKTLKEYEKCDE